MAGYRYLYKKGEGQGDGPVGRRAQEKLADLSLNPSTHLKMDGENQLHRVVL